MRPSIPRPTCFVAGEMGIGNTTVAAALAAALYGGVGLGRARAPAWTTRALRRKEAAVAAGLARHKDVLGDPLQVLRCLGGREIAAMAGAILAARMAPDPGDP